METLQQKQSLLVKKPFTRVVAIGGDIEHGGTIMGDVGLETPLNDPVVRMRITQDDALRQLDPLGHLVFNKEYYPDIWRFDDESQKWYIEEVPRYAFAFQRIILVKHLTHLCGNDIVFELADEYDNEDSREVLNAFKRGWAKKDMEIAWYELARSVKATGDGAIVGFIDKGTFGWRALSYLNGDTLFPHYDRRTGRMNVFARKYQNYDDEGVANFYVDIWDDKYFYCFSQIADSDSRESTQYKSAKTLPKDSALLNFDISGYELIECSLHGFERIPVSYDRREYGPCWSYSQESIENYEMAFSRLAQSNHDFGLPIMYLKGEGSKELTSSDMSYASKVVILPSDGDAGFLNRQDASAAYNTELLTIENQIYRQSFAVRTPELKSGDTPGVAIKMMYSDAVENAINDAQLFQRAIDKLVEIFEYGYGVESEMRIQFKNVAIRSFIEVYIHRNLTEETTNMAMCVQNGFLSKQTASEKSYYSSPQEWSRINREQMEKQKMELLLEEQRVEMQNEHTVELQENLSDIQTDAQITVAEQERKIESGKDPDNTKKVQSKKGSVATGRGAGRPNRTGREYDTNGNWDGRNNWDAYNRTH